MRTRFAPLVAVLLTVASLVAPGPQVMAAGYSTPLAGYTTVLLGKPRSGTSVASGPVTPGQFNQVSFQVLTDQNWATYTDGRQIVFTFACSFDGGVTFPWTEGPFTFVPPALGKNGSSPMFGAYIPANCNGYQAGYSVEDTTGNTGPIVDFGVAAEPIVAGG